MFISQSFLLLIGLAFIFQVSLALAQHQSPFLKEILLGRCYDNHPYGGDEIEDCPQVIGSLMGILESKNDADIQVSDFDMYVQDANLKSPPDEALFWLRFWGDETETPVFLKPAGLMTPEDAPGGNLLKELTFCGVDQRQNCKVEESKAYWSFWEGVYAEFAARVSGKVHMVVEPRADVQFLMRAVVPNLKKQGVTEVIVYGEDCTSKSLTSLVTALKKNIAVVSCKQGDDELVAFQLCQDPDSPVCTSCTSIKNNDKDNQAASPTGGSKKKKGHRRFGCLFWIALFLGFVSYGCCKFLQHKKTSKKYGTIPGSSDDKHYDAVQVPIEDLPPTPYQ